MGLLTKIMSALAAIAGIAVIFFKAKADKQEARADKAEVRADSAEAVINKNEALAKRRQELHESQIQEMNNVKTDIASGNRNHLDNNW